LSIVVPAYNEAERLGRSLDRILAWTEGLGREVEIIVVDDGSRDATCDVVRSYAPRVRLVQNGRNRGKGYSVRNGVLSATGEQILFTDADLSTPIEDWSKLAAALESADIAVGSRALKDSNVTKHQPRYREAMGRVFNTIVQGLAVQGVRDTQCGFKLFRAEVGQALFREATIEGFAFDVEVLFLARRKGYRIAEVPVTWENDDRTRVHPFYDSARMFRDVVTIRLRHGFFTPRRAP
jgi:dolichyl-phosphate beta-glucosyltransferase